jgi:osmotically-inducible protein OsmY
MTVRDTAAQDMVTQELRWDHSINSANIGVAVDQGAVTLTGHVASYVERERAEKAAKRVKGVHAVANELDVHIPHAGLRDDTDIAAAVSGAMAMNIEIPRDAVQVTVRKGRVTLEGTVAWDFQRLAAAKVARDAHGVVSVTNDIVLKQRAEPRNIDRDITAALHRLADVDAHSVHVAVADGVATLTGRVSSWSEVTAAHRAAAAAPGVQRVDVKLLVEPAPVPV